MILNYRACLRILSST